MKKRKILSLILALTMTMSLFPAANAQQGEGAERIVPVTAVAEFSSALSSAGGASTDISNAVSSEPIDSNGTVADAAFCRVNKVDGDNSYLTVDIGYSAPITKVIVRSTDSTAGARVAKLWYSTNGENFTEYTEARDFANFLYRGAEYGMGGYDTKWDLSSSQINARYIRVGAYNAGPLKIQNIIVYTGDEAPALASLEIENGTHTLSPSFSADVYDYTVEVEDANELPTFAFTAANGFIATETQTMSAENGYVSKITVARTDAPTDKKVYTVRAISAEFDAMLPVTYAADGCTEVVDEEYCSLDGGIDLSNPSTMYFSNVENACYTVDLGRVMSVSSVRFNQRQNNDATNSKGIISNATSAAYFEKLEVSTDGISFTDVTVSPTTGIGNDNLYGLAYYQINFTLTSPVNARYIRVSNDGDGPLWIRGTEVLGRIFDAENIDYLKDIELSNDGGVSYTSLDGFNKDTLTYAYNIAQRNSFPQVSGVKAYDGQTVETTQATVEKPYATLKVTSQSGKEKVYKINFIYSQEITQEELIKWEITPYYELCTQQTKEGTLEAAIDCEDDKRWIASIDVDAMYTIDLGMVTDVTKIHYWQGSTAESCDFFDDLEISTDGVNFTNVTESGLAERNSLGKKLHPVANKNWWCVEYSFTAPTLARYIKVSNDEKTGLRIYGIEVYRNIYPAYLDAMSINGGTLSPSFDSKTFSYEVVASGFDTEIEIASVVPKNGCSVIETNHPSATNGYIGGVKVRDNNSGEENTYTVSVKFPDTLEKINITPYENGSSIGYKGELEDGIDGSDSENGWSSSSAIKPRFAVKTDVLSNIKRVVYYQDTGADIASHFERISISKDGVAFTDVTEFVTRTDVGWDNGENTWGHNYYVTAFEFEIPITAMYVRVENNYGDILNIKGTEIYGYNKNIVAPELVNIILSHSEELIPAFSTDTFTYEVLVDDMDKIPRITGIPKFLNTEEVTVIKPTADNGYRGKLLLESNRGATAYIVKMYEDSGVPLEDVTELSSISITYDNLVYEALDDFDRDVKYYRYPIESIENIPYVRATPTCDDATVKILQANKDNPTARITVTSKSGNVTDVYTVVFTYNLALNQPAAAGSGEPYLGVDGDLSTRWKTNTAALGGGYFSVLFGGLCRMYSMTLYSPLTKTTYFDQVYVSRDGHSFEKLDDVTLVQTGRVSIGESTLYEYEYKFPTEYMDVWAVKVRAQDVHGEIKNEISELEVYGERLYLVSGDSLLKSLTLDSAQIKDFSPNKQSYSITIGADAPLPQITSAVPQSDTARCDVVQATPDNPVATVTVTAQNEVSKNVYTVHFVREVEPDDNNYLSSLTVGKGKMIPQFSKAENNYTVYIENTDGVLSNTDISASAEEGEATVVVSPDGTTVTVTSVNGAENVYNITPVYSSSKLTALSANGYTISPQFAPNIINYTVSISDTDGIPKINTAAGEKLIFAECDVNATMQIKDATADYPMSVISITDETGYLKSIYTITYVKKQSLKEAQAAVLEKLSGLTVSNSTDLTSLASEITSVITNDEISAVYNKALSRIAATSTSDGKITGELMLNCGTSAIIKINLVIPKTDGSGSGSGNGGGGGGGASFPSTTFPDSVVDEKEPNETGDEIGGISQEAQAQIKGHWSEKEATVLAQKGIIKGKDGSYALEDNVTRAEFIAMLVRVFELDELPYNGGFADVSENEWFAGVISAAHSQGLIEGSDGKAHPNNNITREESVKLLISFVEKYKGQIKEADTTFYDGASISPWAMQYVAKAVSGGYINGMGNNQFVPKGTLTRAQAMVMLYRVIFDV